MLSTVKTVIVVATCWAIIRFLLSDYVFPDYQIWRPGFGTLVKEENVLETSDELLSIANPKVVKFGKVLLRIANGSLYADTFPNILTKSVITTNDTVVEQLIHANDVLTVDDNTSSMPLSLSIGNHSEKYTQPTEAQFEQRTMITENVTSALISLTNETVLTMVPEVVSLKSCPVTPPGLVGPIAVWFDKPTFEEIEKLYSFLEPGGHGKPKDCRSRHRVAIIVPYRDRESHLRILLHNLHSLLTKQQLDYAIFVVEPIANQTFNRAKLMNIGYAESIKLYDWQCFIFHDVDLLPEDDRNIYSCPKQPRHMSVAIDKFQYKLPYGSIFGGISAISKEQFVHINGFSNDYWGWGGEDDDLSTRVTSKGLKIMRYPTDIARYKMIKHKAEKSNPLNVCRYELMRKTQQRQMSDGLSSLEYVVEELQLKLSYTHILVDMLEKKSKERLRKEGFVKC